MKRPGAFRNSHTSMGGSRVLLIVKCFSVFHDTIPAKKKKKSNSAVQSVGRLTRNSAGPLELNWSKLVIKRIR